MDQQRNQLLEIAHEIPNGRLLALGCIDPHIKLALPYPVVLLKIRQLIPQTSQQVNVRRVNPALLEGLPHEIENGR